MHTPAPHRYDSMTFNRCGRSGLQLPAISLGCWHNFGDPGTDAKAIANESDFHDNCRQMLFTAFDWASPISNLANNYGPKPGAAESRVGRILKELPRDEDHRLVQGRLPHVAGPVRRMGQPEVPAREPRPIAEAPRSRLRRHLLFAPPGPHTPFEETLGALDHAVRSGKALYTGISSYSGAQTAEVIRICEANGFVKPIIHQPSYSALNRWIEPDLLPVTRQFGIGVIAFCPLDQGMLTDKYLDGIPTDSRAGSGTGFLKRDGVTEAKIAKVRKLQAIAKGRGQSTAQLRWRGVAAWSGHQRPHRRVTAAADHRECRRTAASGFHGR